MQILLILLAGYLAQRFVAKGLTRLGERYPFPPQLLMPLRGGLRWLIMGSASMPELVGFRVLQGLVAGPLYPMTQTLLIAV